MTDAISIFDRGLLRRRRARAAGLGGETALLREVAERLADRLDDINRRFPLGLDLGCRSGTLARILKGRGGVETLVQSDLAPEMARQAAGGGPVLAADEEFLPFGAESFDLILSCLSLHWVNDLPGALVQIRHALKHDGLFLAALLGGETLKELRQALLEAEIDVEGGASPRVSPFADLRDLGGLLQRAGFALPVADLDSLTLDYQNAFTLVQDLRVLGETNAVAAQRRGASRRETLLRAASLYQARHGRPDGRIPASFQVLYLTGWAPHASQQQPLAPGSAQARLAAALDSEERPAGEPARPGPRGKAPEG
ncbi:MAG: methyltransferase domain-containing protein [Kiloniellales bacterium]|nr:methyltransferase domain-containing protein [Kiloniellales bacterium]